jgi:NADP-dependent 3-hydroxy acid dehydrogenase YdfG
MDIADRVVVITGASSGIGLAIARHLSTLGATLVLAARDADALHAVEHELPRSVAVPADVTDAADAARIVEEAVARFGRIDVLVNNAARAMSKPVEQIDLVEYAELLDLNVIAPLRLMQLVVPQMRAQRGGQIVNISSQSSIKAIPRIAGYASTKAALNVLSLTARTELAPDGITVSIIRPGIADTGFGQHTPSPEPAALRRDLDGNLLAHVLAPETVAAAVADIIRSGDAELDLVHA